MRLAEGIRKHGFRKWYERELLQSHAHMALTFLCAVGVFAAFEAASQSQGLGDRLFDAFSILLCGGVGLWSLRRYLRLLGNAEAAAHQADCPQCETYGRIQVEQTSGDAAHVQVRCKKCGHEWVMHE